MANKRLFQTTAGRLIPQTDGQNEAGGAAYILSAKQALAQYAATGCMNSTFYTSAEAQLATVLELCQNVSAEFIGKTAVYCREHGFMKDVPALLVAVLSMRDHEVFKAAFLRVIDSGKMLRNFVQIMRSGAVGRKSLGSLPKRMVTRWLNEHNETALFRASIGQSPSLADVVKMVHPKPHSASRKAFYGYLIGREHDEAALPQLVREFEAFKADTTREVPRVPFRMLTALELGQREWRAIARGAPWQMTRMNLNTFARHGVFDGDEEGQRLTERIADRLRSPKLISRARVFPYQLMAAYNNVDSAVPHEIREALHDAMEIALQNVPKVEGKVFVLPDVSGSMSSPVTGYRRGATSAVRCIDIAALVAAALMRQNRKTEVLPFEHEVVSLQLTRRDSVMTNAQKLARIGGGGTNCSAPLALLNKRKARGDLVIYVSDNESWVDSKASRGTATMVEWRRFQQRNKKAKLVCIDVQPYRTVQAAESEEILNIGGFSDRVFEVIDRFARGTLGADHWVGEIEKTELVDSEDGQEAAAEEPLTRLN